MRIKTAMLFLLMSMGIQFIHAADVNRSRTISSVPKDTVGFGSVSEINTTFLFTINASNVNAVLETKTLQDWGVSDNFGQCAGEATFNTTHTASKGPEVLFAADKIIEGTFTKCGGTGTKPGDPKTEEFKYTLNHDNDVIIQPASNAVSVGEDIVLEAKDKETGAEVSLTWTFKDKDENTVGTATGTTATFNSAVSGKFTISGVADSPEGYEDKNYSNVEDAIVYVIDNELKSVTFTSDHGLIAENSDDWTDAGEVFSEPEWEDGGDNNPISHTMNTKLTLKVKIKVEPEGITFDLKGDGPDDYVDFNKTGEVSTGEFQEVTVIANKVLPNQIDILTKSIDWSITVNETDFDMGTSGAHKIYVTYGTPARSKVTEYRIKEVCEIAKELNNKKAIADAIFDDNDHEIFYHPEGNTLGPENIWLLHNAGQKSQCPGLAKFLGYHLSMLGIHNYNLVFCYALANGTYAATEDSPVGVQQRLVIGQHANDTSHGDHWHWEGLYNLDNNGILNNYEAFLLFEGFYYAVPFSRDQNTPKGLHKKAFKSVNWFYINADGEKTICNEVPWVEALD